MTLSEGDIVLDDVSEIELGQEGRPVKPPHAVLAEVVVQRAFSVIDTTARHMGGNARIRDHELRDNTVWCNTKTGWLQNGNTRLGFSPVNWKTARNPEDPKRSLDLVAVVPIYPEQIEARWTKRGIVFEWDPFDWFLFPASELQRESQSEARGRDSTSLTFAELYRISKDRPLTVDRFDQVLAAHDRLE